MEPVVCLPRILSIEPAVRRALSPVRHLFVRAINGRIGKAAWSWVGEGFGQRVLPLRAKRMGDMISSVLMDYNGQRKPVVVTANMDSPTTEDQGIKEQRSRD